MFAIARSFGKLIIGIYHKSFKKEKESQIQTEILTEMLNLIQLSRFTINKACIYDHLENILSKMKTVYYYTKFSEQVNSLLIKGQICCLMSQMKQSYEYFNQADNLLNTFNSQENQNQIQNDINEGQLLLYKVMCSLFITKLRSKYFQVDYNFAEEECEKIYNTLKDLESQKWNDIELDVLWIKLGIARGDIQFLKCRIASASAIFYCLLDKLEQVKSKQQNQQTQNEATFCIDNLSEELIKLENKIHFRLAEVLNQQLKYSYSNLHYKYANSIAQKNSLDYIEILLNRIERIRQKLIYLPFQESTQEIYEEIHEDQLEILNVLKLQMKSNNSSNFETNQLEIEGLPVNNLVATCLLQIAQVKKFLEPDKEKAKKLFIDFSSKALEIRKRIFGEVSRPVGDIYCAIGAFYAEFKNPQMALVNYTKSLEVFHMHYQSQNYPFLAYIYYSMSQLFILMDEIESAKESLQLALASQGIDNQETFNLEKFMLISEDFRGNILITGQIFILFALISIQQHHGCIEVCQLVSISAECVIKQHGEMTKLASERYQKCVEICQEHQNTELEKYYKIKSLFSVRRYKMILSITQVSKCLKNIHFYRPDDVSQQIVELFDYDKFTNDEQIELEFSKHLFYSY